MDSNDDSSDVRRSFNPILNVTINGDINIHMNTERPNSRFSIPSTIPLFSTQVPTQTHTYTQTHTNTQQSPATTSNTHPQFLNSVLQSLFPGMDVNIDVQTESLYDPPVNEPGLTQEEIERNTTSHIVDESIMTDTMAICSICRGNYDYGDNVIRLNNCEHMFHRGCIHRWFENHRNCPLCRTNVCPNP